MHANVAVVAAAAVDANAASAVVTTASVYGSSLSPIVALSSNRTAD